jgi:hypothetical protein
MSYRRFFVRRQSLAWLAAGLLVALMSPSHGQVNNKAYADYFLVGQFGEVCTMCDVMVLCEAGTSPPAHQSVPADGSFTLYHIQPRTFWSQVGTIWEWFIANFSSKQLESGHRRPVTIHTVVDGIWAPAVAGELHIALDPPLLATSDGREIERIGRRWRQSAPPAELGYCQRLPLWEALKVIDGHSTGGRAP